MSTLPQIPGAPFPPGDPQPTPPGPVPPPVEPLPDADAYAALTDAGSFAAARTVPGTGEDLVAEEIKDRRKGAVAIATHYRWVITTLDLAFF